MDLLTKCLLSGGLKKDNAIDNANIFDDHAFDLHEDAKFLNNEGGFKTYNSMNQG